MDNEEKGVLEDRCSECGSSKGEMHVAEITCDMMEILGQIKQFVSTLDSSTVDHQHPTPKRLSAALRLMAKAKAQLLNAEDTHTCNSPQEVDLQAEVVENMGLLQSHIDENIRLRKVKDEVTEVMDMLSSHLEKIGLKISVTSTDGLADSMINSEADNSAIEREEDETGTSLAEEEEDNMSGCNLGDEASSVDDAGEVNIEEITDDAVDEGIEKGDLETTKENQKESLEDTWTDDTDAGTTDDDMSSLTSEASNLSDVAPTPAEVPAHILLKQYLKKSNVKPAYVRVETPEDPLECNVPMSAYRYSCSVMDFTVDAHARNRRSAKLQAAQDMLRLLVRHQEQGTLPSDLKPFTEDELEHLRPLVRNGYENAVNRIRRECKNLGMPPPVYMVVSTGITSKGLKEVTVQCNGLELSARATASNKRKARRLAARNILVEYDGMNHLVK